VEVHCTLTRVSANTVVGGLRLQKSYPAICSRRRGRTLIGHDFENGKALWRTIRHGMTSRGSQVFARLGLSLNRGVVR
jgi:hypothetical protein